MYLLDKTLPPRIQEAIQHLEQSHHNLFSSSPFPNNNQRPSITVDDVVEVLRSRYPQYQRKTYKSIYSQVEKLFAMLYQPSAPPNNDNSAKTQQQSQNKRKKYENISIHHHF